MQRWTRTALTVASMCVLTAAMARPADASPNAKTYRTSEAGYQASETYSDQVTMELTVPSLDGVKCLARGKKYAGGFVLIRPDNDTGGGGTQAGLVIDCTKRTPRWSLGVFTSSGTQSSNGGVKVGDYVRLTYSQQSGSSSSVTTSALDVTNGRMLSATTDQFIGHFVFAGYNGPVTYNLGSIEYQAYDGTASDPGTPLTKTPDVARYVDYDSDSNKVLIRPFRESGAEIRLDYAD